MVNKHEQALNYISPQASADSPAKRVLTDSGQRRQAEGAEPQSWCSNRGVLQLYPRGTRVPRSTEPAPRGTRLHAISSQWTDTAWRRTHMRILGWCGSRDPALHRGRVDVMDVGQSERSRVRGLVLYAALT